MTPTRWLARPLLSSMFVAGGIDSVRHASEKVKKAEKITRHLTDRGVSLDTTTMVQINGAVQVGAGVMLAFGRFPRLAALVLAGSLVPTTLAAHRFWEEEDPDARAEQRGQFLKNASMLGGLLLAAVDTGGRPSLAWWANRAAHRAAEALPSLPTGS
jgi:putative oxidoreductase